MPSSRRIRHTRRFLPIRRTRPSSSTRRNAAAAMGMDMRTTPPAAGGTKPGIKIPNPLEVLLGGAAGLAGGIAGAAEDAAGLVGGVAGGVSDFLDSIF